MRDHLSDYDIQSYVLDRENCTAATEEHMKTCERCRVMAANYSAIFTEISLVPLPSQELDVEGLVLAKLPAGRGDWGLYFLLTIAGCMVFAACWLFRRSFLDLVGNVPSFALYVMMGAMLIIMLFRVFRMFRHFRQQLKELTFS